MEAPVQPGDVLAGKYRVERVLGQGGMGVVVAARHLELGELFAIKLLLPQALSHSQAVDRFLREARASARLKGEHIAKVYDVGRLESGAPYMVLEFLAGSDLKQLVRRRGPLPLEEAATYLLQACEAIAEAHALGIIHRDLKPANLFLIRRPNGMPCVKVLDFGISKQTAPDGVNLTRTDMALGSPLYMSPEQMVRFKDADARSDIWSLGVVFYELLVGVVPFFGNLITEVIGRILQEEHEPPSQVRPDLPAAVDAIVARCLQKKPEHRFQNIEELAVALRPLVGGSETAVQSSDFATPGRVSLLDIGTMGPSQHAVAAVPASSTRSSWGKTGTGPSSSGSAGKRVVVAAGIVLTVSALGGLGVWLARGTFGPAARMASQPGDAAVREVETWAAPDAPEMGVPAPSIEAPAPVVAEPSSRPAAADAPATPTGSATSPAAPLRRMKSRGAAQGGSTATPTPAPAPTAKPSATASPPRSTAAPQKPKHEGIF